MTRSCRYNGPRTTTVAADRLFFTVDRKRRLSLRDSLLLRTHPTDALDRQRRPSGLFGDLAILLHDEAARGLVAVEAAEQLGGHAPVGGLAVVFIDDVEEGEFAFGIGSGFLGHEAAFPRLVRACQRK